MSKIVSKLIIISVFAFCLVGFDLSAQTSQQIQQFKNLPRAQQEQLAQQMGIDVSSFSGQSSNSNALQNTDQQNRTYPRGTQFDEYGNPINPENDFFEQRSESNKTTKMSLFGLELFANSPSTFSPTTNIPVPANYILGPGDELVLQLYGKQNNEYLLQIGRDGNIIIPQLGPFNIATKSFSEAKTFLTEQIKQQVIGVNVSLSMGELRTIRVFVTGEAYKPGPYNVSSLSTITHALFVSGGVTEIASLRNIQLKRAGKLVQTLDLYDLLLQGDTSDDVLLQAGDAIFIPSVAKTVSIYGQVRRPAIYELKSEKSVKEVLELAGGMLATGFSNAVGVRRYDNGKQIQLTVNVDDQVSKVKDGDLITVPKISSFVSDSVMLVGAVARPGMYQWQKDMKVSDLVGNVRTDLLEQADLTYVLVLRQANTNRDIEAFQVDLTELSQEQPDLILKPNDKVMVFSKVETTSLTDISLGDFAFSEEELQTQEKQRWEKRVEDQLFWENMGVYDDNIGTAHLSNQSPSMALSKRERKQVFEIKQTTYFSRKRLLAPVIHKLKEQAKYGDPLQLVEIAGQVKVPGVYPLPVNSSVKKLIKAAGGLTESSYLARSEITRTSINDAGVADVVHIDFSPSAVLSNKHTALISLQSKDRVNILPIPSWQEELKVTVKGEVHFPGTYTIKRGEKLSDLITRVGALTQYGDPDAVVFTREDLKEQERRNLQDLTEELRKEIASQSLRRNSSAGSIVGYDEAKKLLGDLMNVEAVGRLVIDLNSLLAGKQHSDVILEDGDTLYVPAISQSVNVIGEVYVPTSHLFNDGLTYEDYIKKSGGFRALADIERIYILRANGSVEIPGETGNFWFSGESNNVVVKAGDTIIVPFDSDNVDSMTLWTSATQIIYQLAVTVAAIGTL